MMDQSTGILPAYLIFFSLSLTLFALITTTAFVKVSVVLAIVRNALGLPQVPPNLVLNSIALIITLFVSAPLLQQMSDILTQPNVRFEQMDDILDLTEKLKVPLKEHLEKHTNPEQRQFFVSAANRIWGDDVAYEPGPNDLAILIPTFLTEELRRAFEIGVMLYLPFVVIDLVVTTILIAMGMQLFPPTVLSTPFKLLLFVVIEGWTKLFQGLIQSYI